MIDLVGHFGSRLSYATITHQLALELADRNALGNVMNLDDKFVGAFGDRAPVKRSERVLMIADPRDYLTDMMAAEYGKANVGIFVCPNTNRMSEERIRACAAVGSVYTPSEWCRATIVEEVDARKAYTSTYVMPLGVDEDFTTGWRGDRLSASAVDLPRFLHVTTDTFWPGRKGTEELIQAWKIARSATQRATLTIHCLPQLYAALYQELSDHSLLDDVRLLSSAERGVGGEELAKTFSAYDILVAPSRSEGFGIMPLSALVSGMPVLTTAGTGQDQYLSVLERAQNGRRRPVLAGWMQIPTMGSSELVGEDGEAPDIRVEQLAYVLASAVDRYSWLRQEVYANKYAATEWSWKARRRAWVDHLLEWR